jgi:hypothetical protein
MFSQRGWAPYSEVNIELLGSEATYGPHGQRRDSREVVIKLAVRHPNKPALIVFSREIAQAATGMAPGLTGIVGGRPTVYPLIRLFSFLIDKTACTLEIDLMGQRHPCALPAVDLLDSADLPCRSNHPNLRAWPTPAWRWSNWRWRAPGDKGNHSNIGVMARDPEYLPWIAEALTPAVLVDWMSHVLDPIHGRVERWYLPGSHSLNFLWKTPSGAAVSPACASTHKARPSPSNCWKSRFRCLSASPTRSTRGLPPWPTIRFSKPICLQVLPSSSPVAAVALAVAPPMNWPPSARTCCWSDARPTS